MKMKSNKLFIITTIFLAIIVVVLLVILLLRGCDEPNEESIPDVSVNTEVSEEISEEVSEESAPAEHTHNYSDEWSSNETDHWHECECGDKADIANHAFGEWITTKEATETETGSKKRTCSVCGYEETATIPMLSHTHKYSDEWSSNETDHWHECVCGDKADIASHTYGDWTVTKEATEDETGSKYHICEICGYKETVVVPVLSHVHSFGDWKSNGTSHWKECECGEKADLSAHTYGEWVTITEATCTATGSKKHTCTACGYSETATIPATGHSYGDWKSNATSHWKECNCGEKADLSAHTYGAWETVTAATCTKGGERKHTCTACGYSETENISATGHNYVSVVTPPTDFEEGYTTHTCSRCGDSYVDSYTEPTGDYSEGFYYSIWPDKVSCTITGIGTCKDTELKIPPKIDGYTVVALAHNTFKDCKNITSVTLPNTIENINYQAFYGCTKLAKVTIPDSVISISTGAFRDCTSLTSIDLPDNLDSLGGYVFRGCTSLTSIVIPDTVTAIDSSVFQDCTSLKSIIIPDSVTQLRNGTFGNCTSLTEVTLGNGITYIDEYMFYGCTSLVSLTIPDGVTTIGFAAFYDCTNLTNLTIPKSMTSIHGAAFWNNPNLTDIYYEGSEADWENLEFNLDYNGIPNVKIHYNS